MSKPEEPQRIAKLLARAGIASRREIERMIDERRIALNGIALETPATLLASLSGITVDGKPVAAPAPARLFRFHKPSGVLTAERDPKGRRTIYDVLPEGMPRTIPVGRLDLNTEGLLLLTTDGELKRQLELPATQVKRTYRARTFGEVSQAQLEDLIEGIEIDGIRYGSIDANLERRTGANGWVEMTLTEGKNREVRRVLEHLGLQVSRLIRTSYGPIGLGDMPVGAVDEIRQHDLIQFRRELRLPADKRSNAPLVTRARADRSEEAEVRPESALRRSTTSRTGEPSGRAGSRGAPAEPHGERGAPKRPIKDDAQRSRRGRDEVAPAERSRKVVSEGFSERRPVRTKATREGVRGEPVEPPGATSRRLVRSGAHAPRRDRDRDRDEAGPAKRFQKVRDEGFSERRPARTKPTREGSQRESAEPRGAASKRPIRSDTHPPRRDRDEASPAKRPQKVQREGFAERRTARSKLTREGSPLAARPGDKEQGGRRNNRDKRDDTEARSPRAGKRPGPAQPRASQRDSGERGPVGRDPARSGPRGKPRPGGNPRKGPR